MNYNNVQMTIKNFRPLREIVYEELKKQIMTGEILPGARLMEIELAHKMDVSRTPIREAIRKLEKEELVIIESRRGAYVTALSPELMKDTLEVCQSMESLAAFFAVSRITQEQKRKLEKVSQQYTYAAVEENISKMIEYEAVFHGIIAESCNNKFLSQILEQLHKPIVRFLHIHYADADIQDEPINLSDTLLELLEAISNGNATIAKGAVTTYMRKLNNLVTAKDSQQYPQMDLKNQPCYAPQKLEL